MEAEEVFYWEGFAAGNNVNNTIDMIVSSGQAFYGVLAVLLSSGRLVAAGRKCGNMLFCRDLVPSTWYIVEMQRNSIVYCTCAGASWVWLTFNTSPEHPTYICTMQSAASTIGLC